MTDWNENTSSENTSSEMIRLEVGKCYRTRGGQKVMIDGHIPTDCYPFAGMMWESGASYRWKENGRFFDGFDIQDSKDIVAPWTDEDQSAIQEEAIQSAIPVIRVKIPKHHANAMPTAPFVVEVEDEEDGEIIRRECTLTALYQAPVVEPPTDNARPIVGRMAIIIHGMIEGVQVVREGEPQRSKVHGRRLNT